MTATFAANMAITTSPTTAISAAATTMKAKTAAATAIAMTAT